MKRNDKRGIWGECGIMEGVRDYGGKCRCVRRITSNDAV
jgi:hypothetical protein